MSNAVGKVSQIIGPVVDVVFNNKEHELPRIFDSLEIVKQDGTKFSHISEKIRYVQSRWILPTD